MKALLLEQHMDQPPETFPFLFSWGEEEISKSEKQEKELGGYGSGEVVCMERGLGMGSLGYKAQTDSMPLRAVEPMQELSHAQCENGHILCASCCIKVANKCPSCRFPIGYNRCRAMEMVLESVKVSCANKRYGCKEILSYGKITDHENACMYVPCSCPFHGCDFVGTSTKVYAHFSYKHAYSAEHIFFNAVHPIYIEKHQRYQILRIWREGVLFIINHASDRVGSAINIICVGPAMQKRRFLYELVVTDGESTFKLESIAACIPYWSENIPLKKFLLVPRYVVNSSARLKLDVFIAGVPESSCRC